MTVFGTYKGAFPHAQLTRSREGVLEVVLHTNGGTLIFNGYTHEEFVERSTRSTKTQAIAWSS